MLTPSKRLCVCPLIASGESTPSTSRIVGTRSIAWWYWSRSASRAAIRVVVVGPGAAELLEVRESFLDRVREAVRELHLVHRPVRATLARGAVVGDEDD